jgi:hypothetical protein
VAEVSSGLYVLLHEGAMVCNPERRATTENNVALCTHVGMGVDPKPFSKCQCDSFSLAWYGHNLDCVEKKK